MAMRNYMKNHNKHFGKARRWEKFWLNCGVSKDQQCQGNSPNGVNGKK
jgi:hypothetical protein